MFFGEFSYKIDEKGRIPVPPRFRKDIRELVLAPGVEKCITAYTMAEWKKLATSLTSASLARNKIRRLSRALFATAFTAVVDGQGRIALPAPLREHAGIIEDVVVCGANTYLEIWDKAHWDEEKAAAQEQAWQIIETLEGH